MQIEGLYHILQWRQKKSYIEKSNLKVWRAFLNQLQLCQWALWLSYIDKNHFIAVTQIAYYGVPGLKFVLFCVTTIFEKLFFKFQSIIMTYYNKNSINICYLQIVNLGNIIEEINITRTTILTIATTITIIVVCYGKKSVMVVKKKVIPLMSTQTISNRMRKNFGDKIKNFARISANITNFWLIRNEILMMILMVSIKKQIIPKIMAKIAHNMWCLSILLTNFLSISQQYKIFFYQRRLLQLNILVWTDMQKRFLTVSYLILVLQKFQPLKKRI